MQTPIDQPPVAVARMRNTNISSLAPTLRVMVTQKLIDSSSLPCDETGKALSQALQHSFAAPWPVIYLDKDT